MSLHAYAAFLSFCLLYSRFFFPCFSSRLPNFLTHSVSRYFPLPANLEYLYVSDRNKWPAVLETRTLSRICETKCQTVSSRRDLEVSLCVDATKYCMTHETGRKEHVCSSRLSRFDSRWTIEVNTSLLNESGSSSKEIVGSVQLQYILHSLSYWHDILVVVVVLSLASSWQVLCARWRFRRPWRQSSIRIIRFSSWISHQSFSSLVL